MGNIDFVTFDSAETEHFAVLLIIFTYGEDIR